MKIKTLTLITIIMIFSGCKKEAIHYIDLVQIESFQMPDTISLNEIAPLHVNTLAGNGCWSDLFAELKKEADFVYSIKAFGTFNCRERGCVCPFNIVQKDTIIDFQPTQKGTYIFQISKYIGNEKIIIDTLIVR